MKDYDGALLSALGFLAFPSSCRAFVSPAARFPSSPYCGIASPSVEKSKANNNNYHVASNKGWLRDGLVYAL